MICIHEQWQAKLIPMSNGLPALREFCLHCGLSNGGSRLGISLPLIADTLIQVKSFKHKDKTLGEIFVEDPGYLEWLVVHSKAQSRVKKAAARILCHEPYTPPEDNSIYPQAKCYDPERAQVCINKVYELSTEEKR
jgi:hypothetical protein